ADVETDCDEFLALACSDVSAIPNHDRRRLPEGHGGLPQRIFRRRKLDRISRGGIDAGAVGSSELIPFGARRNNERNTQGNLTQFTHARDYITKATALASWPRLPVCIFIASRVRQGGAFRAPSRDQCR